VSQQNNFDIENRIDQYLKGRLGQEQIDSLWVDMIEDPESYEYLKTMVSLKNIYADSNSSPISNINSSAKSNSNWNSNLIKYSVAALVLLSISVSSIIYFNSNQIDALEAMSSLDHVVYRSSIENQSESFDARLQNAIGLAIQGNTTTAMLLLNQIHDESTNPAIKAEAILNIGIIEYNQDAFVAASHSFNRVLSIDGIDSLIQERAVWSLAQSQLALGNYSAAKISIEKVIEIDGAHSRMARNYLKYLR
jgi:tetratricopeptide (TPR) repeat protein